MESSDAKKIQVPSGSFGHHSCDHGHGQTVKPTIQKPKDYSQDHGHEDDHGSVVMPHHSCDCCHSQPVKRYVDIGFNHHGDDNGQDPAMKVSEDEDEDRGSLRECHLGHNFH